MAGQIAIVVLGVVILAGCLWLCHIAIKMREEDKRGGK